MEIRGMKLVACSMHFYYGTFPFGGAIVRVPIPLEMRRVQQKSGAKK